MHIPILSGCARLLTQCVALVEDVTISCGECLVCPVSLSLSVVMCSILWSCYSSCVVQYGAPLLLYTSTAVVVCCVVYCVVCTGLCSLLIPATKLIPILIELSSK